MTGLPFRILSDRPLPTPASRVDQVRDRLLKGASNRHLLSLMPSEPKAWRMLSKKAPRTELLLEMSLMDRVRSFIFGVDGPTSFPPTRDSRLQTRDSVTQFGNEIVVDAFLP